MTDKICQSLADLEKLPQTGDKIKKEALTIEMASFYRVPVGHWMYIMWFEAYF
jgi:hypothetical protein